MNKFLRFGLLFVAVLAVANIGWRFWTASGLISIDATDQPLSEVVRQIERQAGIRLRTNLPPDTRLTMHLRKVPLLHALEVLSSQLDARWSVGYLSAPDKTAIATALAMFVAGEPMSGWKQWSMPPMRMGDLDESASDPREEIWETKTLADNSLHAHLEQASRVLSAQFWAPEDWNPGIARPPKRGKVSAMMRKIASSARGHSAEVFFIRGRPQRAANIADGERAGSNETRRNEAGAGARAFARIPNEEMQQAFDERVRAQIARLPKESQSEALARVEERKKFFAEMAQLTPDDRRARMEERMEQMMNNSDAAARMSAQGTKRAAMKTADQRADGYRNYLDRKRSN